MRSDSLHPEHQEGGLGEPLGPPNSPVTAATSPVSMAAVSGGVAVPALQLDAVNVPDRLANSLSALSLKNLHSEDGDKTDKVITIAISGCPSSGKTTLALLLAQIFAVDNTKKHVLIHQDGLFLPKACCPFVKFESLPADTPFCQATLKNDTVGLYSISWAGVRANNQYTVYPTTSPSRPATPPSTSASRPSTPTPTLSSLRTNSTYPGLSDGTGVEARVPIFRITGPDTDCVAAINFTAMHKAITHAKNTGTQLPLEVKDDGFGTYSVQHITAQDNVVISMKYEALITEMQEKVNVWLKAGHCVPKLCVVDGFLLFSDPSQVTTSISNADLDNDPDQPTSMSTSNLDIDETLSESRAPMSGLGLDIDDTTIDNTTIDRAEKTHTEKSLAAFQMFNSELDIRMFLPTSKDTSRARRFVRRECIDYPAREQHPGQMWKTEGYFEKVAWGNHVKYHKWLLDTDASAAASANTSVLVRREMDASVEDTVRWAVEAVLAKLGEMEG
jgi:cytidylate kinase